LRNLTHCDLLIKFLTTGIEYSCIPPYENRNINELLDIIPDDIGVKLKEFRKLFSQRNKSNNRFWFSAKLRNNEEGTVE